ncbi:MAG: hypothetical protein HYZ37_14955 [Candidatus Solibacter usitatus]|nr:hypothetical protein [Candidatus Solibacter usitatus]
MNPEERFERIEGWMEESARYLAESRESNAATNKILQEMAARQQYHDEAFDRAEERAHALDVKLGQLGVFVRDVSATIRTLGALYGIHEDRLDNHGNRLKKLDGQDDDSAGGNGVES